MKRISSVFARLTSWVENIVAGTLPRTVARFAPAVVKIAFIILASAVAFTATPAMAQDEIELSDPIATEVVTKGSNVRGDPSTDNDPVGTVPAGMTLTVTGCAGTWAAVVAENGDAGFIAGHLLSPNPCPQKAWGGIAPASGGTGWGGASAPAVVPAAPAPAAAPAAAASAAPAFTFCGQTFPAGSVMYEDATVWRGGNPEKDQLYNVVYDPSQAGRSGKAVKGWWYQPCLPGSNREAHEVAIILQAGSYDYVGPECRAWVNFDNAHPFDGGNLIVDRRNGVVDVPPTQGEGTRAFVFVKCDDGDASGFSFSLK